MRGRGPDGEAGAAEDSDAFLEVGRVGRPHGLDGSFHVTRPLPDLLQLGRSVVVAGSERVIERRAGLAANPIVRVEGVSDRDAAQALRGEPLLASRGDLPALRDGEFWAHELEGCAVHRADRQHPAGDARLGTVSRMIALPSCEALEVALDAGGELLVPLVSDAIVTIDVPGRRVEVDAAFLGLEPAQ